MYRKFLRIISLLKYVGIIYFIDLFIGSGNLYFFIYFWLFGLLEIILTLPIFIQAIHQIIGLVIISIKAKGNLPSTDNYSSSIDYILPFSGKWLVVNGGVTKEHSHSWDMYTQRYAYDFIMVDSEFNSFKGEESDPNSFYCYSKDILACAAGVVVEVKDQYKDSYIDRKKAYCDASDLRGNFIVIKHSDDEFSTIAHLKKGSINVEVGDKVIQGQVIGKCGNSGNSSEPHIHFQLQSAQPFFTSFGLPIAFSNIKAEVNEDYNNFDSRSVQEVIKLDENKTYIGRGQEVQNV